MIIVIMMYHMYNNSWHPLSSSNHLIDSVAVIVFWIINIGKYNTFCPILFLFLVIGFFVLFPSLCRFLLTLFLLLLPSSLLPLHPPFYFAFLNPYFLLLLVLHFMPYIFRLRLLFSSFFPSFSVSCHLVSDASTKMLLETESNLRARYLECKDCIGGGMKIL
jgi:hypothetical protein